MNTGFESLLGKLVNKLPKLNWNRIQKNREQAINYYKLGDWDRHYGMRSKLNQIRIENRIEQGLKP